MYLLLDDVLISCHVVSRTAMIKAFTDPTHEHHPARSTMVTASSVAGGTAGLAGGLISKFESSTRPLSDFVICSHSIGGPKNILPAVMLFSLSSAFGQIALHLWEDSRILPPVSASTSSPQSTQGLLARLSPLKQLSGEEYALWMKQKLHRMDAELDDLDQKLVEARAQADNSSSAPSKAKKRD